MIESSKRGVNTKEPSLQLGQVEGREWWLWGYAVAVTLFLTLGSLSLTFPGFHLTGTFYFLNLKEWVRGLAALVLLFDIYTIYQHLPLQRVRPQLAEREKLFQIITENAADMIAVVDRQGHRLYSSPAYKRMLGYGPEELAAKAAIELVHPDDRSRVKEASEKAHRTGRGERLEYRIQHKDGSWRFLESTASAISGSNGEPEALVIVNRDITERKQSEALLEHRALHDGLTGLPNRALFLDRLQRAIGVSLRHGDFRFAVLFIDIDEFKVFNDSLGHGAGDDLLMQIAQRLGAGLRAADTISRPQNGATGDAAMNEGTIARPGGDEFVVLAEELRDPSDAVRVAERIQKRLSAPYQVNNHEIVISASVGIVYSSPGCSQASDMLRDAEIAMYRAKQAGKARCEVFDNAMHVGAVRRLQLETDIRKAVELDEFRVFYQPLLSLQTCQIVGFEALSRWQRAQGIVPPAEFIKVAEETGLILPINRKLIREACQQVRRWHALFPCQPLFGISVNITAKQFGQPDLASEIAAIIHETGMNPAWLDLEITENIAMADAERSARVLSELKALGVQLSIDDFGTGYSSLSRLQQFPVDTLKIDRAFVSGMDSNSETREIVKSIVLLSHSLGMEVVAEGIEREEELRALQQLGCERGQGFLFSRPIDSISMEQLLAGRFCADRARSQAAGSI